MNMSARQIARKIASCNMAFSLCCCQVSSYIIVATRSFFLTEFYRNKFLKIRLKKIPNKFYL